MNGIGLRGVNRLPISSCPSTGASDIFSATVGLSPLLYCPLDEPLGETVIVNYGSLGVSANATNSGATLGQPGVDGRGESQP
mgnify:CR=1 FL=1